MDTSLTVRVLWTFLGSIVGSCIGVFLGWIWTHRRDVITHLEVIVRPPVEEATSERYIWEDGTCVLAKLVDTHPHFLDIVILRWVGRCGPSEEERLAVRQRVTDALVNRRPVLLPCSWSLVFSMQGDASGGGTPRPG